MSVRKSSLLPAQGQLLDDQRPSRYSAKPASTEKFVSSLWHFPEASSGSLYRWYGTLPEPLVERLLTMYGDSTVVDPFAGTGVVLEAAARLGIQCRGFDVNPLGCLVAEARLAGYPRQTLERLGAIVESVGSQSRRASAEMAMLAGEFFENPRYAYTRKWFRGDTLLRALEVFFGIAEVMDVQVQRVLFVVAAQELRNVASVDPRCTHHLVSKQKPFLDVWANLRTAFFAALTTLKAPTDNRHLVSISQGSLLDRAADASDIGLVLAHPPYLGVIHYHLIHRLATDLLDYVSRRASPESLKGYSFDYEQIKRADVSTDNERRYAGFVAEFSRAAAKLIRPSGRCAIIVGDQRFKGRLRHPFTQFIQLMEENGFELEENFIWALHNNGGMHVLRRGHFIDHNYILIFRNNKNVAIKNLPPRSG